MDIDTREWADGVLTDAARKVVKESSEVHCWIICDGDVDPEVRTLNVILCIVLYYIYCLLLSIISVSIKLFSNCKVPRSAW